MHVETETLPGLRLATLRHLGPYQQIGRTFGRLHEIVTRAGLPHRELVGVYHDDPAVTPADQLRADAGVIVDEGVPLPPGLEEQRVPGRPLRARRARRLVRRPAGRLGRVHARARRADRQREPARLHLRAAIATRRWRCPKPSSGRCSTCRSRRPDAPPARRSASPPAPWRGALPLRGCGSARW